MGKVEVSTRHVADVEVAPGLFMPPETVVTDDDYRGYRVEATVVPDGGRLVVSSLAVHRIDDGSPVTGEGLRQIALVRFIRFAVQAAHIPGMRKLKPHDEPLPSRDELLRRAAEERWVGLGLLEVSERDRLKAAGPTDETLRWVALLHRVAVAVALPPVKSVQGAFDVSLRTATNWVAAARQRGYLDGE